MPKSNIEVTPIFLTLESKAWTNQFYNNMRMDRASSKSLYLPIQHGPLIIPTAHLPGRALPDGCSVTTPSLIIFQNCLKVVHAKSTVIFKLPVIFKMTGWISFQRNKGHFTLNNPNLIFLFWRNSIFMSLKISLFDQLIINRCNGLFYV